MAGLIAHGVAAVLFVSSAVGAAWVFDPSRLARRRSR